MITVAFCCVFLDSWVFGLVWVCCGFAGLCWLLACSLCLVTSGVCVVCLDCLVLGWVVGMLFVVGVTGASLLC